MSEQKDPLSLEQLKTIVGGRGDGIGEIPYQLLHPKAAALQSPNHDKELSLEELQKVSGGHDGGGEIPFQVLNPNKNQIPQ